MTVSAGDGLYTVDGGGMNEVLMMVKRAIESCGKLEVPTTLYL